MPKSNYNPLFHRQQSIEKKQQEQFKKQRFNQLSKTEPEKRKHASDFAFRVNSHRDVLYRIAFGYTKERESALDLVQETILQALCKQDVFKENNLAGWLATILRNKFNNLYRDAKTKPVRYEHDFTGKYDKRTDNNLAEGNMLAENVQTAIARLSDVDKMLVKMKYIDQLAYWEISQRLNMPIGSIKSRLYFIRKELKRYLHEYGK